MQTFSAPYYEDYEIGAVIKTRGRTITETDIVNFAGFTGDYTSIHTDREFAANTPFKAPIAHGLLSMSVASGLIILTNLMEDRIIAFEGIKSWEFLRPVMIGDTIHAELKVISKEVRKIRGTIEVGSIATEVTVVNQKGKTCQKGIWSMILKMKSQN